MGKDIDILEALIVLGGIFAAMIGVIILLKSLVWWRNNRRLKED